MLSDAEYEQKMIDDENWFESAQAWYDEQPYRLCEAPHIIHVMLDNPHGTDWHVIACGQTGDYDREHFGLTRWIRYESAEGYWAEYFGPEPNSFDGWSLGAN